MTDNQEKALAFLRDHPNSRTGDIALHLGIHSVGAYHMLKPLVERGLVERIDDDTVSKWDGKHTYKLARKRRETNDVLAWSRKIGHPFGILAAQVMA